MKGVQVVLYVLIEQPPSFLIWCPRELKVEQEGRIRNKSGSRTMRSTNFVRNKVAKSLGSVTVMIYEDMQPNKPDGDQEKFLL